IRFETSEDGECAVFPNQTTMQDQLTYRGVKEISNRVPVKIDHKNSASCHSTHLAKNRDDLFVTKMVSEEGANHKVKLSVGKRQMQSIAPDRLYLAIGCRLVSHRSG